MPFSQESISIYVKLIEPLKDIILGSIGGIVGYFLDYTTAMREKDSGKKIVFVFRYTSLFINMILGGFVAHIVGSSLSEDLNYRDAVIGISGVSSYQILVLAQTRVAKWLADKFFGRKD